MLRILKASPVASAIMQVLDATNFDLLEDPVLYVETQEDVCVDPLVAGSLFHRIIVVIRALVLVTDCTSCVPVS